MPPASSKSLLKPFLVVWILSGLLTALVPLGKWHKQRKMYYKYQGSYNEYEAQQRQYENDNNGDNDNGNGNGNNGGNYSPCKWYQFSCKRRYQRYANQGNGEGNNNQMYLPDWYYNWGGVNEENQREQEEMGNTAGGGALNFVYIWNLLLFLVGVVGLGAYSFARPNANKYHTPVICSMLIFTQFLLMQMIILVRGTIETDDRYMENSIYGWFGQTSVLIFTSCRAFLWFCVIASLILLTRAYILWRKIKKQQKAMADVEMASSGYVPAPEVGMVDTPPACGAPPITTASMNQTATNTLNSVDAFLQKRGL